MDDTERDRARRSGVALVVLSALAFSTAGLFAKGVAADAWTVIFWRGLTAAVVTLAWITARGRLRAEIRACGGTGLAVAVLLALGTAAFIPAFKLTTIANVALIYAAAPLVAATIAWGLLGEAPRRRVIVASLASFGGVAVIVGGSLGSGGFAGDLLALVMTLAMAATMVLYRRRPGTPAALPAALSSLLLLPAAALFAPVGLVAHPAALPVLVAFGVVFAVASVSLSAGARRLPSAETALLSTLETPLAPVLAWLVLAEAPAGASLLGGAVILAAVVASQWPASAAGGTREGWRGAKAPRWLAYRFGRRLPRG